MREPAVDEESKRVSLQVTSLSTQLIDLVDKQSKLEEQLYHQKKENEQLKKKNQELSALEANYKSLRSEHDELAKLNESLEKKLEDETQEKTLAKEEVSNLQSEVEDLSASLFDEANKMVSQARQEAHNVGKRNESLVAQLKEKDALLENLQTQLRELKNVIQNKDDQSVQDSARNSFEESRTGLTSEDSQNSFPQQIIYSPTINSIRFDLKLFNEFNRFIADLKYIEVIRDTNTKFLKKLVADDVEPALRIDLANGIGWLSKRSLMGAFIDGRVVIEPVSGINETYRINFQNNKTQESDIKSNLYSYPAHSPPVAIDQPCAICGEDRNDILEHSRLYILKVHALKSKEDSLSSGSSPSSPIIAHQYPLCSYCLFRVRSACDLFAFLRSLKTNVWKLDTETSIRKSWVELSRLRSKLFWSKVGIWDLESNIQQTKIYPGTDDLVYKALANIHSPKATVVNTVGASTLNDSFALDEPNRPTSVPYKASPLANQVSTETETTGTSEGPENAVTVKETPKSVSELEEKDEQILETEPQEEDDITSDILNDYSQDEDEDEVSSPTGENSNVLSIQTDRPQDALLDSEENTPIVGQINRFNDLKTPTKSESGGFDFVRRASGKAQDLEDTKAGEARAQVDGNGVEDTGKIEETDDEDFVDA